MSDSQEDFSSIKTHLFHHKIALYGILGLLAILTYGLIVVIQLQNGTTQQAPVSKPSVSAPNSIAPQSQYQNPFDKDSQYVNPFSDYKNPFDNLE